MQERPVPLPYVLERPPAARALLHGSPAYPQLQGEVLFYPFLNGSPCRRPAGERFFRISSPRAR